MTMTPESLSLEVDKLYTQAAANEIDIHDGREKVERVNRKVLRAIASGECTHPRECAEIVLRLHGSPLYW